jgi:hypothetical protein
VGIDSLFNITNGNNYVFDDTKIELISGKFQLVPIVIGAEAYLYTKLDENAYLVARDSSGNNRDGAFQGGLDENDWSSSGKINSCIEGKGAGYINFNGIANFVRTQAFSLECWMSFSTAGSQNVIGKQRNAGNFEGFFINTASGKIRFVVRDDNGNNNTVETNSTYNDSIFHHVVATYDGSSSITGLNIYIDNILDRNVTSSGTLTGIISNPNVDLQISGRDGNNNPLAVGTKVDEVLIYDRELTPAEIAFRWNFGAGTQQIPGAFTTYTTDSPDVLTKSSISITTLLDFAANIVEPGSDSITFAIVVNGVDKYWNGSIWVDSTGVTESNTIAQIQTGASSLVTTGIISIKIKAYLTSDDGTTTPELLDFTVSYDFVGAADEIDKTTVTGIISDIDGLSDTDIVKIRLNKKAVEYKEAIQITGDEIEITPDSNGNWLAEIADTTDMEDNTYYIFEIKNKIFKRLVPKTGTIEFNDLPEV